MIRTKTITACGLAVALLASGCGDDNSSRPTAPNPPVLSSNLSGTYGVSWLMQVLRTSDGFMTSFNCSGSMTLQQSGSGELSGFSVVGSPCPAVSYPLRGRVSSDGSIEFLTGGPKPPQGPCPGVQETSYTGIVTGGTRISARGVGTVRCPEFGEHVFTYIVSANKNF
jgi:hypothetical protein